MTRAALGIGANIGDRLGNIERAIYSCQIKYKVSPLTIVKELFLS